MEIFWNFTGKIAVLIGGVLSILKIIDYLKRRQSKLVAKIEPFKIIIPPQIHHFANDISQKCHTLDIRYELEKAITEDNQEAFNYLKKITSDLRYEGDLPQALKYTGFWKITLKNRSANLCQDIHLDIPYCNYATIIQHDEVHCTEIKKIIEIKKIHPDETIEIQAWPKYEPNYSAAKKVKLTHSHGKGIVKPIQTIDFDSPTNGVAYLLKRIVFPFLISGIILSLLAPSISKKLHEIENELSSEEQPKNENATTNITMNAETNTTVPQ